MVAPTDTQTQQRSRRRKKIVSAHVAPRGQRAKVARRVDRVEVAPVRAPLRRRPRERSKPLIAPPTMIQRRTSLLELVLSARTVSAIILVVLVGILVLFFQSDEFYIHRIEVGGIYHLTAEEVFTLSGVADLHLFWVDPVQVRENVLRSPSVADANVLVSWPPHPVQIEIQEREPALIWEQAGVRTWIDVRGRVMPQRIDLAGMLRIVVDDVTTPVGENVVIPQDVVDGALQLRELYADLDMLRYDGIRGLGFQDTRGWQAWFGAGTNMLAKVNVYNAIVDSLLARNIHPEYIDIGNVDAPYYKIWWQQEAEQAPTEVDS